jgi:hypothetical protein
MPLGQPTDAALLLAGRTACHPALQAAVAVA